MRLRPSPIVALNRAIAIAERDGPGAGLKELHAISDQERLDKYPFFHAALGEFELRTGKRQTASEHFQRAIHFARNSMERGFLERRVDACADGGKDRAAS